MYFTAGKHLLYKWKYLLGQRWTTLYLLVLLAVKAIFISLISKSIH